MAQTKSTSKQAATAKKTAAPMRIAAKKYVSSQIPVEPLKKPFRRADLIFDGLDHSGASFEARVFLNNEKASDKTPKDIKNGYAGTFHIFGHGGCFGDDVGHCEVRGVPRPYDPRPAHPLTPARKVLIATEALRRMAKSKQMTVTVVPIIHAGTAKCDLENVLKFDKISVVTYN